MTMFNRVVLVGRLTKDPELRYTANGVARTTFTLAVDRPYTRQDGQRQTDFLPVVVWNKPAEVCALHLKKGRLVLVDGRVETRAFENNEGQRIRVTEIIGERIRFLDPASKSASADNQSAYDAPDASGYGNNNGYGNQNPSGGSPASGYDPYDAPFADPFDDIQPLDITEDDLPF